MSVTAELIQKLKLKPKAGETAEDFSKRVHQKVTGLSDDAWGELTEETQGWFNAYVVAIPDPKSKKTAMDIEKEIIQYTKLRPGPDEKAEEFVARVITLELPTVVEPVVQEQQKAAEKTEDTEKEPTVAKSASKSNGKPEAKKAADKKPSTGVKGRPKLPDDAKITILSDKNPYREGSGSFKAFEKYKDGMTVAQAEKAGIPRAWILWDRREGHISTDAKAEAAAAA